MKSFNSLLCLLFFALMGTTLSAQQEVTSNTANSSVEFRARWAAERMSNRYQLSSEQEATIRAACEDLAGKIDVIAYLEKEDIKYYNKKRESYRKDLIAVLKNTMDASQFAMFDEAYKKAAKKLEKQKTNEILDAYIDTALHN